MENTNQTTTAPPAQPADVYRACGQHLSFVYERRQVSGPCIVYNPRDSAFLISSQADRTNIRISATPYVESLFMR
jgi:hypothetical protein